jgi:hypothetical protein
VTRAELADALTAYVAGLDAEIGLLHQIESLAGTQRRAQSGDDFSTLTRVSDRRNRLMAALAELEHRLHPIRALIVQQLDAARAAQGFEEAVQRHRDASALINRIMSADRTLVTLLEEALATRRQLAHTLEAGGATLAAYRRVLTPAIASAELVDRHG